MLNKSNFWPPRGSDHSSSVKIATFRGPEKVQHHQLEGLQQRPFDFDKALSMMTL
ncbi:hypothetical protein [Serratia symbiotica]|uniref:hypothetical protein n=1 Tax=Serratia symbiotica TaxID=138074 RepID=UPI0030D5504A|nr:hypothetical protein [Serratia symbiotica]